MRLLIAACVLGFGLPGLALAQEKTTTTKPTHGGHGSSVIKNRDTGGAGTGDTGAALKGNSQRTDKRAGPPPAEPKQ